MASFNVKSVFQVILGALFAYISLIPFYYFQPIQFTINSSTFTLVKYFPVLLVGFLILLAMWICRNDHVLAFRAFPLPMLFSLVFYIAICLLSTAINAEFITVGFAKLFYFVFTGALLSFLIVCSFTHKEILYRLVQWIVFISVVVAFYGITVYIFDRDYLWGEVYRTYNPYYSGTGRISSSLGNPICVGSYLVLCLPFNLWTLSPEISLSLKKKALYGTYLAITLIGLWLTFSRGAWIASGVVCGIYLYPRIEHIVGYLRRNLNGQRLLFCLILLLLLMPVIEAVGFKRAIYRVWGQTWMRWEQVFNIAETESFRLAQYGTTLRVLQEHPLLGLGFGNFTRLFEKYKHPSTPLVIEGITPVTTTDNMYLMVACETGVLGLVSFLVLLFALAQVLYCRYRTIPPGPDRDLHLAAFAAFCGFLVNMVTWDALNQPTVRMTFWMLMGIALSLKHFMPTELRGQNTANGDNV
jgi:putative inorganic carbon (hco3(-)) transporter